MSHLEIKKGKSKLVELYKDYVIKKPLNNDIDNNNISEYLILNFYGRFENLKEIFFWKIIEEKYLFFKDSFANIYDYDIVNLNIKAEKLEPVDPEYFYNKFFSLYKKFYFYKYFLVDYLDNHTIDNYENYGFDKNRNLKLLDYSFVSSFILKLYNLDLNSINLDKLAYLEKDIINDLDNLDNVKLSTDFLHKLLAFVITLKYHNNLFLFYYFSYKYKLLTFKEIINAIIGKWK